MKAVIMAGGQGTRLRPLTSNQPKPMLPIANRPIMEHIVALLRNHGVTDSIATVQFLGRLIRSYFGNGEDLGVQISYATEETPLGTAGSVKNAEQELSGETFLVISGDALTDIDLTKLVDYHRQKGSMATLCLKSVENPLEFGIVITREDGHIERFLEKPNWGQVFSDTINTGIYVLEPEVFDYIPADTVFDFSNDLFPMLLDKGLPMYGYVAPEYWCDVGHYESYLAAHRDVLEGRVGVEIPGFQLGEGIWVGEGTEIDPGARIEGPAVIGVNCRIEDGCHLREFTVLGDNVVMKEGAFSHRAVVHDNAYIGPAANLRGCVIGKNTDVRGGARIEDGVIVGDDCSIGDNAVINPNVKIYPFKTVEAGALITKSIIWESRGVRTLFGPQGVSGLINVDVTPEIAVRLAMAYASTLKKGSTVTASRDATRAARAMKRAVVAGLNSSGVHCHDLELSPVPVARYYVHTRGSSGGMTLRTSPHDPQSISISFVDTDGTDLDEGRKRKVERAFYREEFRRAYAGELGELHYPPHVWEYYSEGLLTAVDVSAIRDSRIKLVVDYGYGSTSLVLPTILGRLGCEVLAVNAVVDESRSVPSAQDISQQLARLSDLVSVSASDLGVLLDPTGETLWLVDDTGRVCDSTTTLLLATTMTAMDGSRGAIALPVSTSRCVAELAREGGMEVVWTKTNEDSLMDAAASGEVRFAGNAEGSLIFPELVPTPDAMMAMAKFLQHRARSQAPISQLVSSLPRPAVVHETVACPWEMKGAVMRSIMEQASGDGVELIDGVKTFHKADWTLVLPDPARPLVHVWAESDTESKARALAGRQLRGIRNVVG
ncbi:MAG TPA: mannose-1-phosphate guanyltransferase [Actinomycetota bacterium]|nr:mannose-1-phosphate guanyltransferase [Actinomycetota bacterium]